MHGYDIHFWKSQDKAAAFKCVAYDNKKKTAGESKQTHCQSGIQKNQSKKLVSASVIGQLPILFMTKQSALSISQ